jgi:hypothetical protein
LPVVAAAGGCDGASGPGNCFGGDRIGESCAAVSGPLAWKNYEDGYAPAGFYKDGQGIVHLQGSVSHQAGGPVSGATRAIFILPEGYRPEGHRVFLVEDEGEQARVDYVEILESGRVVARNADETSYMSLDGIQFRP